MRLLAAALVLFLAGANAAPTSATAEDEADILWQLRSAKFIELLGRRGGIGPGVRGYAWWGQNPCIVMTPPPPAETAPEAEIRDYVKLLAHEIRHCREKRNFHR